MHFTRKIFVFCKIYDSLYKDLAISQKPFMMKTNHIQVHYVYQSYYDIEAVIYAVVR